MVHVVGVFLVVCWMINDCHGSGPLTQHLEFMFLVTIMSYYYVWFKVNFIRFYSVSLT